MPDPGPSRLCKSAHSDRRAGDQGWLLENSTVFVITIEEGVVVTEGLQSPRAWSACIAIHALRVPAACPRCGRISVEPPREGTLHSHRCPHCGQVWSSTPLPRRPEPI